MMAKMYVYLTGNLSPLYLDVCVACNKPGKFAISFDNIVAGQPHDLESFVEMSVQSDHDTLQSNVHTNQTFEFDLDVMPNDVVIVDIKRTGRKSGESTGYIIFPVGADKMPAFDPATVVQPAFAVA